MVKTVSVASLFRQVGRRNKSLCNKLLAFMYLCFLSASDMLIHLIFIGTETPEYDRKVIEGSLDCKLVFC